MMSTVVENRQELNRYEILVDGVLAGVEVYEVTPGKIALIHTEIYEQFSGQGLAATLVTYALNDARSRGLAVLPRCPYVAGFIAKHPEDFLDLVPASRREQFGL
jgi:predicted GNAT family acetyltransferase